MFIFKKDYDALIERVNRLERKVEKLEEITTIQSYDFGPYVDLPRLCQKLPKFIDKRAEAVFDTTLDSRIKKVITLFLDTQ